MIKSNQRVIMLFWFILIASSIVFAATIEDYVASLDTSFYDGTINITTFTDEIVDGDSNGQNDTIIFNLTTDNATSDNFTLNIFFEDDNLPVLSDNRNISSSDASFIVNISTFFLSESQYAYYARIYNDIGQIVYESKKYNTSTYTNYETGTNVTAVTDENVNNDFIRINLTLDVTKNETVNISVNLNYDDSFISGVSEVTLTTPSQTVSIGIDNETIKSAHYQGIYSLDSIQIGNKLLDFAYNTSSYDYEDFAKTPYIRNITSRSYDNNSNNLSETLQFNFTLNITSSDTYSLEASLYDDNDNFVATIAKNETLSTGLQTVILEISGEDIYSTYYNGEFILSYTKLSVGSDTKDIIFNAYKTDMTYYSDFERPPLPDLSIEMNVSFVAATNISNLTISITNVGEAPAFNIFIDIFDNDTYENQSSLSFLDINESETFYFFAENTTNSTMFTAIVDFDNFVDESDESNNIVSVQSIGFLTINSLFATPSKQHPGENVTITANITHPNGIDDIDTVLVGIIPPSESEINYTMSYLNGDLWQYEFVNFTNGSYSYTVYVNDTSGSTDSSSGTFEIQNSTPIMINSSILPASVDTNDTLLGICKATDLVDDNIKYHWRWYKNNILYKSGDYYETGFEYSDSVKNHNWLEEGLVDDFINLTVYTSDNKSYSGNRSMRLESNTTSLFTLGIDTLNFSASEEVNISSFTQVKSGQWTGSFNGFNNNKFLTAIFWHVDAELCQFYNGSTWNLCWSNHQDYFDNLSVGDWVEVKYVYNGSTTKFYLDGNYINESKSTEPINRLEYISTDADIDNLIISPFYYSQGNEVELSYVLNNEISAGENWVFSCVADDGSLNSSWLNSTAITVEGLQSSSIQLDLVYPTQDINVTQNEFFNFTTQVCCYGDDCGEINVSLDPIGVEYTPTTETHCNGNTCSKTIYAGTRFVNEDKKWKRVEEAKSLKDKHGINLQIRSDDDFPINIVDFNLSSINICVKASSKNLNKDIPLKVFTKDNESDIKYETTSKLTSVSSENCYNLPFGFDKKVKWGTNSTNVSISFSGDGYTYSFGTNWDTIHDASSSNTASHTNTQMSIYSYVSGSNRYLQRVFIPFNTTDIIPENAEIVNASLRFYVSRYFSSLNYGKTDIVLIQTNQSSVSELTTGDHDTAGAINNPIEGGDRINVTGLGYYSFVLNGTGLGWINTSGFSKLGIRSYLDADDIAPVDAVKEINFGIRTSENITNTPTLNITYTLSGEDGSKGLISTTLGDTPFYTNGTNPTSINLTKDQCQEVTWLVNATGDIDSTHEFFAYANITSNMSISNITSTLNITIVEAPAPLPSRIGLSLVYPTQNINVMQYQFFNFTVKVSCLNSDCGDINVSLDPVSRVSFFEGWESGSISSNWSASGDPGTYDRQQVDDSSSSCTTINPRTDTYMLRMDVTTNGNYETNIIKTTYDFSGASNVVLDFYHADNNDEQTACSDHTGLDSNCDGYFFTCDGNQWYELGELGNVASGIWQNVNVNVSNDGNFCQNVNSSFAIKFTQYDNYGCNSDGRLFDDINITYDISSGGGTKSGLVSTTVGDTPFYTNESNPKTISLNQGENQEVTFWVNATGDIDTTHEFFAFANITSNMSISNITDKINITIVSAPPESSPQLSIKWISPTENLNVTQNEFFKTEFNVSCSNADCGEVNVSLDPKEANQCKGNNCTKLLAKVSPSKSWLVDLIQEDEYIDAELVHLKDNEFEIRVDIKQELPVDYKWGTVICANGETGKVYKNDSEIEITPVQDGWCINSKNQGFELLSKDKRKLPYTQRFNVSNNTTNFEIYGGDGSFIIVVNSTSEGIFGSAISSWNNQVFYDPNNDRWHVLYINNNSRVATYSSDSNGQTWSEGSTINLMTPIGYNGVSCVLDTEGSSTYIHCALARSVDYYFDYNKCELLGSPPYINCSADEIVFSSTAFGSGQTTDDTAYPKIILDSDDCVVIAFALEDDSEVTADEWEIVLLKEDDGTTCGDGDFDYDEDMESGFPIFSIQSQTGLNYPPSIGSYSFGDTDSQLFWIDTDSTTSADLETIFFNGTTDSVGTQRTLDFDIEFLTDYHSVSSVIIGNKSISFTLDDGTQDLDAYITNSKNAGLSSQVNTGIDMRDGSGYSGLVASIVDTQADGSNDIWIFAVDDNDPQDIYYSISTNGGSSWSNQTLWVDEAGTNTVRFLSAYFNDENCDIMVRWVAGSTSPYSVSTNIINTGSCEDESSSKSGLIPIDSGTPFYTNASSNPLNISLNEGDYQVVTFWVNATGDVNTTHEFFSFVNKTSDMSISNITSKINITIRS